MQSAMISKSFICLLYLDLLVCLSMVIASIVYRDPFAFAAWAIPLTFVLVIWSYTGKEEGNDTTEV